MKVGAIIVVLLLLALAYYYFVVIKGEKDLSFTGYADNEVLAYLNDQLLTSANDWTKRFSWQGRARSGDRLVFVVKNVAGPGGFICSVKWGELVVYSGPSTFQTTSSVGTCGEGNVRAWWNSVDMSGLEQAKWIWGNNCVDQNPTINTFTYVLP